MDHAEYEDLIALDALDGLDAEERPRLEEHLRDCAACRTARDETREAAALIALSVPPVAPPPMARARVMREVRGTATAARPSSARWWLAAAAVLLVVAGLSQFALWKARKDLEVRSERIAALTQESLAARNREAELQRRIDALTTAKPIELAGQEVAPQAGARVFVNGRERTALVFFQNLPESPADKSYQLWIIRGDRPEPQSAGVFQVGPDGRATLGLTDLPLDTEIKAFALTLEPRGGVSAPTGAKYLVGGV